ncbi:MAG: efflux RND transporter periplasmic adaptor subunit [Anaerolineae bacterium]|nr:efflux RND transporter periplasmic adaptor subunit [Thermoflexales bacterium]MDW8406391.1 efflux RND transporter periplasmic adaptor subunit [Anaerolineae bacterium]
MLSTHTFKRFSLACVAGVLLTAGCSALPSATQSQATFARTATVTRGTLLSTVNATGNIQAEAETRLGFQQPGKLAEVRVQVGSQVKRGDVLARLDTSDLELALAQAQTALIIANAAYSRTVEGARGADIRAAEAALRAAQANYAKVKAGAEKTDLDAARAQLLGAEAQMRQAQAAYDLAFKFQPNTINDSPTVVQLRQAQNNLEAARRQYERLLQDPEQAQLAAAWQRVEEARARLEQLQQPAQDFDLQRADAERKRARLAVEQAQRRLDKALLVAPADGVVGAVGVEVGEMVGTQPVITLLDTTLLHIDVKVDEIDVAKVKAGQTVRITLDALPDVELVGRVDRIASTSTVQNGIVSYAVRIVLDPTEAPLRVGMTANASIIVDRRDGVLLAPNWAVRRDRASGKTFVTVLGTDNQPQEVEVQVGLRGETQTEIVAGLSEGQTIVAPQ